MAPCELVLVDALDLRGLRCVVCALDVRGVKLLLRELDVFAVKLLVGGTSTVDLRGVKPLDDRPEVRLKLLLLNGVLAVRGMKRLVGRLAGRVLERRDDVLGTVPSPTTLPALSSGGVTGRPFRERLRLSQLNIFFVFLQCPPALPRGKRQRGQAGSLCAHLHAYPPQVNLSPTSVPTASAAWRDHAMIFACSTHSCQCSTSSYNMYSYYTYICSWPWQ